MPRTLAHAGLLVCVFAVVTSSDVQAQAERLLPDSSLTTEGYGPFLLADVNADGLPDLAYTTPDYDDGLVRLAGPDGSFGPPALYPKAQFPVVAADFTEDGAVDLACCRFHLRVLPNLGDGTFGPFIKSPLFFGTPEDGMQAGDVNGDGHLDLIWKPYNSHAVLLSPGFGDGTFGAASAFAVFGGAVYDRGLADMDNDGDLDVFASHTGDETPYDLTSHVGWCANLGDGTSGPALSTLVSDNFTLPDDVAAYDFDADGFVDLVNAGGDGPSPSQLSLFRNLGSGLQLVASIPLISPLPFGQEDNSQSWIGDVDGDDIADILVGTGNYLPAYGQVFFLAGEGGFSFAPPIASDTDLWVDPYPGGTDFAFVDLDGDGHVDVVGQSGASSIPARSICAQIAWGLGDGTFECAVHLDAGEPLTDVAAADLDGDGAFDLLTTSIEDAPHLVAHLGVGDGSFALPVSSPASFAEDLFVGDATGDGVPDALATSPQSTGGAMLLVGTGDGSFTGRTPVVSGRVRDAAFGDVDSDGALDLAVSQPQSGGVTLFKGVGDGSFVFENLLPAGADAGGVELADVTADGQADVVVTHEEGTSILVYPLTRSFSAAPPIELPTGQQPHDVVATDLEGDGDIDLATACGDLEYDTHDTLVTVHRADGGTFSAPETWVAELSGGTLAATDFDRDGLTDLLVTMRAEQGVPAVPVEILQGGPASTQGQRIALRANDRVSGAAAADFDGNGFPDVVIAPMDDTELRILLDRSSNWTTLGHAVPSSEGIPLLVGSGVPSPSKPVSVTASSPSPALPGLLFVGLSAPFEPLAGGYLVPLADVVLPVQNGSPLLARWPVGLPAGTPVYLQAWFVSAAGKLSASNAVLTIAQ